MHSFQPRRGSALSSARGWRSAPRGRPHPPLGLHAAASPRAVGPVCGESGDTRDRALAPTLPAFRPAGPTTLLTTRGLAQRRNPASPACLRTVRARLSFHWVQWPSITEAGGRACALSAAIATACPPAGARRGAEGGCCAGAGRGAGRGYGECCGTPVFFPIYCLSCQDLWIHTFSS